MKRILLAVPIILGMALIAGRAQATPDALKAEMLVDKAKWTVIGFKQGSEPVLKRFKDVFKDAAGVVIFPKVIKGGIFAGIEGGHGVLVSRNASGAWGYPAFYTMAGASFGFQFGAQVSEVILVLQSPNVVRSIMKHKGKLGVDLEVTVINQGAGMGAAVTANLGVDIMAFSKSAGIFGGGSLEGSVLVPRTDLNEAYYGPGATPENIVLGASYSNSKADALRAALGAK